MGPDNGGIEFPRERPGIGEEEGRELELATQNCEEEKGARIGLW